MNWLSFAAMLAGSLAALVCLSSLVFNGITLIGAYIAGRTRFLDADTAPGYSAYPTGIWRAYLDECLVFTRMAPAWLLAWFHPGARGGKGKDNTRLPVLFLHGYTETPLVWRPILKVLRRNPHRRVYTLWMRPVNASIHRFRDQAQAKIDAILKETGHKQVIIVGHSMGGIVARDLIHTYGPRRVARLITLATPHRGTSWSFIFPATPARQMQSGSEFLAELGGLAGLRGVPLLAIATLHDNIVIPFHHAWLEGAELYLLHGVAHIGLTCDRRVVARVAEELAKPDSALASVAA